MISTPFSMAALAAPAWTDCQKIVVFPFGTIAIVVLYPRLHARRKADAASTSPRTATAVLRIYFFTQPGRGWLDVRWIVSAGIGGGGPFGVRSAGRAPFPCSLLAFSVSVNASGAGHRRGALGRAFQYPHPH